MTGRATQLSRCDSVGQTAIELHHFYFVSLFVCWVLAVDAASFYTFPSRATLDGDIFSPVGAVRCRRCRRSVIIPPPPLPSFPHLVADTPTNRLPHERVAATSVYFDTERFGARGPRFRRASVLLHRRRSCRTRFCQGGENAR